MKHNKGNDKSSLAAKKATLSAIPSSTGRHRDPKMKSLAGKAMQGGKLKK
tara:strand:- start:24838 stop:24987 length:150 start_codon:yes stop_codon:yes gene_type:complete